MCSIDAMKPKSSGRRSTKGKQRPAYKRRVKPPYSYVELISMAIKSSPKQMKTLREILDFMQAKFPCFRGSYVGWKNSVRHNLSAANCFTKILRNEQRPYGKDNYWMLNPNCSHCFNIANGQGRHKRIPSGLGCNATAAPIRQPAPTRCEPFLSCNPSSSPVAASPSDASFREGYASAVHHWVANQAMPRITQVPFSNSDIRSSVQYIELRHSNHSRPDPPHHDSSGFDFSSATVSCMHQYPSTKPHVPMTQITRTPSSSSAAESLATRSSGFDSSASEAFDLETFNDNLDMIMDDLFVPDNDIDLSLYEYWSNGQQTAPSLRRHHGTQECQQFPNAGSPVSHSSTSYPPSPVSTSSVSTQLRTSTPPQPHHPLVKHEYVLPISPDQRQVNIQSEPNQRLCHTSSIRSDPQRHVKQEQFHSQHESGYSRSVSSTVKHGSGNDGCIVPGVWMFCSDGSSRTSSPQSSPVPNLSAPSSPYQSRVFPTFTSMTTAVRDSLNLDCVSGAGAFTTTQIPM